MPSAFSPAQFSSARNFRAITTRVTASHPSLTRRAPSALPRRYLKASLPKLERLDLARNQISDAGARALSAAIAVNTTLEYLNLESNHVAERGGRSFVEAITGNTTLSYLNLTYNAIPASLQQEIREGWASGRESTLGLHL